MSSFLRNRQLLFIILAIVLLLAVGGAWYYYSQVLPAQALPAEETIRTTRVRRGDLVITASGTGTLIPSTEVDLGFSTSGVLAEVAVEVGNRAEAGDVLARLDDTDAQSEVTQAEISLRLAELELATLTKEPDAADLAAAQASLAEDYPDALPQPIQLSMGTLMLEETPQAVTAEQAQELLPLWQMLRTLQQSDTAAQAEIEAVLNQIQAAMTPDQLAAIEEMDLTPGNMRDMFQELGLGMGRGEDDSGGQGGGFGPPPGVVPGSGGGRPGVPGVPGSGGGTGMSPEERATAMAERMSSGFGAALMDRLIELLESRAGES